ncbi:hypothetical protein [Fimbriiglobus ruber]|uniref:Uncharacterized protein n=1 Tax=Fimbriiglobus ruber TaxID=1908690 RepID=A0A225DJA5_9BACT|nr:hypothetical protein [Fimbriiglobus ruber]OWK41023.1 hypothetical protein FRUB_04915 [Fimbriiglobus ruber]
MVRPYDPRSFLRHVPFPLLRTFFATQNIPLGIDWSHLEDGDVEPVFQVWIDLPPGDRERAEQMFRNIHDLADAVGTRMLVEEIYFQRFNPLPENPAYGPHAVALQTLLTYPFLFHQVLQIRHADLLPGRYWHRVPGLLGRVPDAGPHACQRLKLALANYFRLEQGRGHRVTVEYYPRPDGTHYYFCFPDDYTQTHVGHDLRGTLRRSPVRPAFELVYVFDPATGVLEMYAPGTKAIRAALETVFCGTLLDAQPPDEVPYNPAYQLDRLLDGAVPFATDPEDAVREVRVKKLRVSFTRCRRRAVLEGDPEAPPEDVFAMLGDQFPADRYPRGQMHVTQATFALCYRPTGGGRDRTLTFDVTYPNGCTLKNRPDDQRALGEKYLRRWGITRD